MSKLLCRDCSSGINMAVTHVSSKTLLTGQHCCGRYVSKSVRSQNVILSFSKSWLDTRFLVGSARI